MVQANIHPVTGIAYGVINANNLDGEVLHEISFVSGMDALNVDRLVDFAKDYGFEVPPASETESTYQYYKRLESAVCQFMVEKCEESEETAAEYDEVLESDFTGHLWYCEKNGISTLYNTDDNTVIVMQSTETAMVNKCSPCYPNAGDLDTPNADGIQAYTVPMDWKNQY